MTMSLIIAVYHAYLKDPCARDAFRQKILTLDFMSPELFEKTWDTLPDNIKKKCFNISKILSVKMGSHDF